MSFDQIDYRHYLDQNKLKESHRFQPVFEAVENAYNAIEERKHLDRESPPGSIEIRVHRDQRQPVLEDGEGRSQTTPPEISGITVTDNGVGFRHANWNAFKTVYTSHKKLLGGKGVGRLSYLQAFGNAEVTSTFREDGKFLTRVFSVTRTPEGVSDCLLEDAAEDECKTRVSLLNLAGNYRKKSPKQLDAIARHFVVHFFQRLSVPDGIVCSIADDWDNAQLDLAKFCNDEFVLGKSEEIISTNGHKFSVMHSKCKTRVADKHQVMLCANGRVVSPHDVAYGALPTKKKLDNADGGYFYVAFVNGELLDEHANPDRLGFSLEDATEDGSLLPDDKPSLQDIVAEVSKAGRKFLASDIDPLEAQHRERVQRFCRDNIVYKPLLNNRMDQLMAIQFGLSDRDFSKEIWGIYSEWKGEIRRRFNQMAATVQQNTDQLREFTEGYREIMRDMSQMAFHELAAYVTDRRAVIDFLETRLALDENGKFKDEDAVHDIFFPRKQTSNDIAWDESNLWLIDERLAFQQFAASDIPLAKMALDGSESMNRPDVAVAYDKLFDTTFAFADRQLPFTSLTLVEFKKPERKNYDEKENPIAQAIRYIREIREHKVITHKGQKFRLTDNSPIHIYVICHIVDNLKEQISGYTYIETPDGEGIWLYMPLHNALVQIMTFEKLIADAKKRNEVFFQKLGIDKDIDV